MTETAENTVITVRQALTLLGRANYISIQYECEEYDITDRKPLIMSTFGDFVVDEIISIKEREYSIYLKQEYIKT